MSSNEFSAGVIKDSVESSSLAAETESVHDNPSVSPSASSSTCANNGSVKSSTSYVDTESVNDNHFTSSTSATATGTAAGDASILAAERIAAFIKNPINPNPSYTNTSAEASIAEHTAAMTSIIEDFDAVMAGNNADEEEEGHTED